MVKRWFPQLSITLVALITHGLLLLNDGIYWDDWLWVNGLDRSVNFGKMAGVLDQMGHPPTAVVPLWLFHLFGWANVVFGAITISGLLVFLICDVTGVLSRLEALLLALLSVSFPGSQTWVALSTAGYVFYYAVFLTASFVALKANQTSGATHWAYRLASLVLLFLSYNLNSLLVLSYALLLLLACRKAEFNQRLFSRIWPRLLLSHIDYVLLPFIYWSIKHSLFSQSGVYASYNTFDRSPIALTYNVLQFFIFGALWPLNRALEVARMQPILVLSLLLLGYGLYRRLLAKGVRASTGQAGSATLFMAGCLLFVLGIFPYAAVGLSPGAGGWSTRHVLLLGLPMAVLLLAVIKYSFWSSDGSRELAGMILLVLLSLTFSLTVISDYLSWQARSVKDRSLIVNLGANADFAPFSVYWIDDQFPVGRESGYRYYEWSSIFEVAYGDESRVGFNSSESKDILNTISNRGRLVGFFNLSLVNLNGPQARLVIRRGEAGKQSDVELSVRYFYYRWFRPSRMRNFLQSVTEISLLPMAPSDESGTGH